MYLKYYTRFSLKSIRIFFRHYNHHNCSTQMSIYLQEIIRDEKTYQNKVAIKMVFYYIIIILIIEGS